MSDLARAQTAAQIAGEKILTYYKRNIKIDYRDNEAVTEADKQSGAIIISQLQNKNYGMISEEKADDRERMKKEFVWIVDPLDGTTDFIQGTGEFSIMIGLVHYSRPILGVVYLPLQKKLYFAQTGKGAYLRESGKSPKRLRVSQNHRLDKAVFLTSRNHYSDDDAYTAKCLRLPKPIKMGSNGVKISLIAEGGADCFFNSTNRMSEYDSCAPDIILHEAGGRVTDKNGRVIHYNKEKPTLPNGLVASNGYFHDEIIVGMQDNKKKNSL
ncbi:3'(2'),5'-bisphosphate nucleotidase CysQ [Patescibacteria group bacterium]